MTHHPSGILILGLALATGLHAADTSSPQALGQAIQKLGEADNYSWTSSSESAPGTLTWRQGPTEGRTQKGGPTFLTFSLGDNQVSMAFAGDKAAICLSDQWTGLGDLTGDRAWIADRLRTYKPPVAEAGFLAQHATDFADSGGSWKATLSREALAFLLSRGRRQYEQFPQMKGTVQFWIEQGVLTKYEFSLNGRLDMEEDGGEVEVNRTTTVTVHHVGKTSVEVPADALAKLK